MSKNDESNKKSIKNQKLIYRKTMHLSSKKKLIKKTMCVCHRKILKNLLPKRNTQILMIGD